MPPSTPAPGAATRTLSIDVGGTNLKASVLDARGKMAAERVSIDTPYPCPPKVLVKALVKLVTPLPAYDRISVRFPGYVRGNRVITAPHYGDALWRGFDLAGDPHGADVRRFLHPRLAGLSNAGKMSSR